MNRKGFTLYELLAVITITGILLLIAIPSINKIIENSRRSTFAKLSQTYINAVKNLVLEDSLKCTNDDGATWLRVDALPNDYHCYYNLQTKAGEPWEYQTSAIMETGGKSPWGNTDIVGTIRFYKKTVIINGKNEIQFKYLIRLRDMSRHGTPGSGFVEDGKITRAKIASSGSNANISTGSVAPGESRPYLCYLA